MTKAMISTKQHICKAIYTIVNSLLIMYITSVLKQFGRWGPLIHHFVYFRLVWSFTFAIFLVFGVDSWGCVPLICLNLSFWFKYWICECNVKSTKTIYCVLIIIVLFVFLAQEDVSRWTYVLPFYTFFIE